MATSSLRRDGWRRAAALVGLVVLVPLVGASCSDDDDDTAATTSTASTTSTSLATTTSTAGTTTSTPRSTTTTSSGIDPMVGAGTAPVSGEPAGDATAVLTDVTVGRHEGFDRVVFEFRGDDVPGFDVAYVELPILADGSGDEVEVAGEHFLEVRLSPASGFDSDRGVVVYEGPDRLPGTAAGTSQVREVVRTGDFEAVLTWVIGLSDRVDFRVDTLSSPVRVVVDVRNH